MTHRIQPIRAKIDDIPLSASIECLDPPEQSQFSTHTTDLLSNIHHNIYNLKTSKPIQNAEIESQFGTQSIQQIMSGIQTPSNLDSISREIQIAPGHSLQATHSRHNSKDFFLVPGHSPAKNFANTEKVINTNFSKDGQFRISPFSSTGPVRNLRDFENDDSENILKERRVENARKTVSYKNFGIKHDDDQKPLNITPLGQPDLSGVVEEAEQTKETEETERQNHRMMPRSEGFSRIEKRALSKNPVVGALISESSKQLDKINKMLENHRQKNATKKMFQGAIENSYAQNNTSGKYHPSDIRPMDEGQSGPSDIYLQTDGQENSLENMMAGPQELEPKYTEQSADFFTDRLEDHFDDRMIDMEMENVLEGELDQHNQDSEERLERELGLDDLEFKDNSHRHMDNNDLLEEEDMLNLKEEKMMKGKKKMNKLQKDFENYRTSNPPKGTRMTADSRTTSKQQFANKITALPNKRKDVNGAGAATKVSKENYLPERKTNPKQHVNKKPTGFHSIDLSNQSLEHPSKKNMKGMNNTKDKGSYAKIFNEYKEKRKQQNVPVHQNHHHETTPKKDSPSSNSDRERSTERLMSKYLAENIGRRTQQQQHPQRTTANREDSLPLTDRSSARKHQYQSTPQASARVRSRTQGPGYAAAHQDQSKNIQLMRYCDIRNAHKSNQKQTPQRDSSQPINRLELRHIRDNIEEAGRMSNRERSQPGTAKGNNASAAGANGGNYSVSTGLIKPILVISDRKSRRGSVERAQTFRDNNDKIAARAGKKEPAEMEIPDYQKEILRGQPINPEEIMRETHQIYSSASSTKNSRVTQESLMKSLKLRQEMFSKAFGKGGRRGGSGQYDFKDYESQNVNREMVRLDFGLTAPLGRDKKREEEIYNKNMEWLSSKQRKLDKMHNKEMEDEMRECTFKPQLLTKELNLKLEYENEINMPRSREKGIFL